MRLRLLTITLLLAIAAVGCGSEPAPVGSGFSEVNPNGNPEQVGEAGEPEVRPEPLEGSVELSDETGMLDEEDIEAAILDANRADVAVTATATSVRQGSSLITATAETFSDGASGPRVVFELGDGVVASTPLPETCELVDIGVACTSQEPLIAGEKALEFLLPVEVVTGDIDSEVTISITSVNNPISNDPNPDNNVVVIDLAS